MRMLHLFQWKLKDVIDNVQNIKEAGFDTILLTPVQPSKNDVDADKDWYKNYQVLDLSVGNSCYGYKEDLIQLCNKCKHYGLKVIQDIIITHYANTNQYGSLNVHKNVNFNLRNNPFIWRERKLIDYGSRWSITHHCNGLPGIRMDNYEYQELTFKFMNELIDCGVDGFRIDSCKMIQLPHEFNENNLFFKNLNSGLKKKSVLIGELIFEDKELIKAYNSYGIMNLTEINRDQWNYNQDMYIPFVESHDSFYDKEIGFSHKWKSEIVVKKYKNECLKHKNSMFFARPFDNSWMYANK